MGDRGGISRRPYIEMRSPTGRSRQAASSLRGSDAASARTITCHDPSPPTLGALLAIRVLAACKHLKARLVVARLDRLPAARQADGYLILINASSRSSSACIRR